jgi:hypothetical protein
VTVVETITKHYNFSEISRQRGAGGGGYRCSTVVKVLRYISEGRWFDSRWCHLEFFVDIKSYRSHYGPGGRLRL